MTDSETMVNKSNDAAETVNKTNWGSGIKAALAVVGGVMLFPLATVLSILPPSWRIFYKLHRWSLWQMQKASNADAIANVRRSSGREDFLPAAWVEGAEDEKERSGYKIKGIASKRFDPAVSGNDASRVGKADLMHVNEDDAEVGTWAEASMDNAFQMDRESYLFRDAEVSITNWFYEQPQADSAVADGGVNVEPQKQLRNQDVSVAKPGVLEDVLVPIKSREGYDGQVVSFGRYSTMKSEQSDQETIRDAANQAWSAAKLDDIGAADLMKWVLILGAIGLILLFHAEIGAFISGLGSGGGGASSAVGDAVGGGIGMISVPFGGV